MTLREALHALTRGCRLTDRERTIVLAVVNGAHLDSVIVVSPSEAAPSVLGPPAAGLPLPADPTTEGAASAGEAATTRWVGRVAREAL